MVVRSLQPLYTQRLYPTVDAVAHPYASAWRFASQFLACALLDTLGLDLDLVAVFFAHRGHTWANAYLTLKVGEDSTLAELQAAHHRLADATKDWANPRLAASRCGELERAWNILKRLSCQTERPTFTKPAADQQERITREFLRRQLKTWRQGEGEVREITLPAPQGTGMATETKGQRLFGQKPLKLWDGCGLVSIALD